MGSVTPGRLRPLRSERTPGVTTTSRHGPDRTRRRGAAPCRRPAALRRRAPAPRNFGVRHAHAGLVPRRIAESEGKALALGERRLAAPEGADPELRPLKIGKNPDRPAGLRLDGADEGVAGAVLGVGAVAEIEAEHVHAGLEQRADDRLVGARRPECRDKSWRGGVGARLVPLRSPCPRYRHGAAAGQWLVRVLTKVRATLVPHTRPCGRARLCTARGTFQARATPNHGVVQGARPLRQNCGMQRESERVTAGEMSEPGAALYLARTTSCDARTTFQARATRACATLSRGIPLIPLNPAESRIGS